MCISDRRYSGVLCVTVLLAVLTLPRTCDAQGVFCDSVSSAFPACACRGAEDGTALDVVLDCSSPSLGSVPAMAPGSTLPSTLIIHKIILANSGITQLGPNILQGVRVRSLDLSGNSIGSVDSEAFRSIYRELRELQMDGNDSGAPPQALNLLSELETLTLRNYQVDVLGDSTDTANQHLYFLSLHKLKHLTLQRWQISAMEPEAFLGPDSLSSLTILDELDLLGLPLAPLAHRSLQSLTSLKISRTGVFELTESAFERLANLRELDLSDNNIRHVRQDSFKGLGTSLRKLSLASNFLNNDLQSDMEGLSNLPNLEELDLSGNENINSVPDFSQLNPDQQTSVRIILSDNKIPSLSSNAFNGIALRLHTLDLSQNSIASMHHDSFDGVSNLQVLRLSQQSGLGQTKLVLPQSLSQSSDSLTHLFLDGTPLDETELKDVLPNMAKLEVLDLSNTRLSEVPSLQKMTALQELNLDSNSLTSLSQDDLVGPRSTLKSLSLSNNRITRISSCVFAHYTSFPITLALESAPLICDCRLGWLHRRANDEDILFDTGSAPVCSNLNSEPLLSKDYDDICSNSEYTDGPCEDPYATNPPDTGPEPPSLTLQVDKVTSDSITLSWRLSDYSDLRSFSVRITNTYGDSEYVRDDLASRTLQVEAKPLLSDTQHRICVIANFQSINSITSCTASRTEKGEGSGPNSGGQSDDSDSTDAGIIIGAVVGAILLLVVLAAIAYLVFIRRRPKKGPSTISEPPRNFAKAELPAMTEDSRSFTRPKRPVDHPDGMQVVAISDGQMNGRHDRNGSARVGRAAMLNSDGSYKLMSAGASSTGGTSTGSVSGSQSLYENDRGLLPKTPPYYGEGLRGPRQPGYYNSAFEKEEYDEIGMQREVTL